MGILLARMRNPNKGQRTPSVAEQMIHIPGETHGERDEFADAKVQEAQPCQAEFQEDGAAALSDTSHTQLNTSRFSQTSKERKRNLENILCLSKEVA